MNFAFSEEQEEFRSGLRRFCAERCPPTEVRKRIEAPEPHDAALWQQLSQELGLQGIAVPESLGGQGFGFLELGIVCEELGRALVPEPFFSSACLAIPALQELASPEQRERWLPPLASGAQIGTLAWLDAGDGWAPRT